MTPTLTPLHHAIATGLQGRGATSFRPTWLTTDIQVFTPAQSTFPEAIIHYEGNTLTGHRDDQWGYIERETYAEDTTYGADADDLLHTLTDLVDECWNITLIEIPEAIATELLAA